MNGKGATGLSTILGVAAVVLTAGFLLWLYWQTSTLEETVTPAMEEVEEERLVTLAEVRADPSAVIGLRGALDSARVADRLGRATFTLSLTDTTFLPVLLNRDLIQEGIDVYGGDRVSIRGNFYTFNDSIRGEWLRVGAADSAAADRLPSVGSFLLADSVEIL